MGNSEDYLDSLLNSINHSNMSVKREKSVARDEEEDYSEYDIRQDEMFRQARIEAEERRREDAFLRDFERGFNEYETEEFLENFEMELEAETADDLESGSEDSEDDEDFFEDIKDILSVADKHAKKNKKIAAEQEGTKPEGDATRDDILENMQPEQAEISVDEEPLVSDEIMVDTMGDLDELLPEGESAEEGLGEKVTDMDDEAADLLNLLNEIQDDADIAEIGDLLNADQNNIELDESGIEIPEDTPKEESVGQDGKKKGFWAKLAALLFGDDEEEEEEEPIAKPKKGKKGEKSKGGLGKKAKGEKSAKKNDTKVPEEGSLESISEENLQILQELDAATQPDENNPVDGNDSKAKRKAEKKEKKAKLKAEKAAKRAAKEAKKAEKIAKNPKLKDNSPPLPKAPVVMIFAMAFSLMALILIVVNLSGNISKVDEANEAMSQGEYMKAYRLLYGLELDEEDTKVFQRARFMALIEEEKVSYEALMGAEEYELALDALIRGIGRCETHLDTAREYGFEKEVKELSAQFETNLMNQFDMDKEKALELYAIDDKEDYSIALKIIIQNMKLIEVEESTKEETEQEE